MSKTRLLSAVVLGLVAMLAAEAYAASCPYCGRTYGSGPSSASGYLARIRAAHEASCSARRRTTTPTRRSGPTTTYTGPSAAELAARRRRARGHALNERGCSYYKKQDWANAIKCFAEAARLKPGSSVIKKNLTNARNRQRQKTERELREWREKRKKEEAKRKVDKILDEAALKLKPGNSATDLSFDAAARAVYDGAKPHNDASVVDLRDKNPDKLVVDPAKLKRPKTKGLGFGSLDEPPVPGKPKVEPEKSSGRIQKLSDEALKDELARMRKTFVKMKGDFQADVKSLQQWARESQEAQRAAVKASVDELVGIFKDKAIDKLKSGDPAFNEKAYKIHEAALKLQKELTAAGKDYAKSPRDREAKLRAAHSVLKGAYDFLGEHNDKISKVGGPATGMANYLINYSLQATKWEVSRRQIKMIHENLDKPGGKLEAQKALKAYHEKLMKEHNRRKALK